MPLIVHCGCGKRLVADERLAGKRAKCPQCGAELTIPAPEAAGQAAATSPPAPSAPKRGAPMAASPAVPEMEYGLSNQVWVAPTEAPAPPPQHEEYGLLPAAPRAAPTPVIAAVVEVAANACPECGKTLAEKAVICVDCGFDLRSGKKLKGASDDMWDRDDRPPKG